MLIELTEYSNSVKKTQAEIQVTLSETKIYRDSTVEWMKPRINQ